MFEKFRDSILVVSYRSDGLPSIEAIATDMQSLKRHVSLVHFDGYRYVLSPKRAAEVLVIGE